MEFNPGEGEGDVAGGKVTWGVGVSHGRSVIHESHCPRNQTWKKQPSTPPGYTVLSSQRPLSPPSVGPTIGTSHVAA